MPSRPCAPARARHLALVGLATVVLGLTPATKPVAAFSLFPDQPEDDVRVAIETATRWSAEPDPLGYHAGLRNGLRVAVAADFAESLGATSEEDRATVARVIREAFRAWQTPELRFDVEFSRVPVEGIANPEEGYDIDLFAVRDSHPAFGGQTFFGIAYVQWLGPTERLLTNGNRSSGLSTLRSDIFINIDTVGALTELFQPSQRSQALQRLLMHEIGHTLGFGHPNAFTEFNTHFDTDQDPENAMRLDPLDPAAGLQFSAIRSSDAIMSNAREVRRFLFFTELQNDDRGGRDALYPSVTRCPGDCDGNGEVNVAEVLTSVSVALGEIEIAACFRADHDESEAIEVDEILRGVRAALEGCPASELFESFAASPRRRAPSLHGLPLLGTTVIHCGVGD